MMMLASAVLTVGTMFLVSFTFYVLFTISTFISYEIKRGMEAAARPEGPFRLPEQNRARLEKALMTAAIGLAVGIIHSRCGAVLRHSPLSHRIPHQPLDAGPEHHGFSETVNLGDIRQNPAFAHGGDARDSGGESARLPGVKWRGVTLNSFNGKKLVQRRTPTRISIPPEASSDSPGSGPAGWNTARTIRCVIAFCARRFPPSALRRRRAA